MQELKIRKVSNGYLLTYLREEDKVEIAIEEPDEDDGENIAMSDMLYQVAEYFFYQYNKWGDKNLDINFKRKGHKLD